MAGATAACASLRGGTGVDACRPILGTLPPGTSVMAMVGEYRVTIVATAGARAGQATEGRVVLIAPEGGPLTLAGATVAAMPLVGTTDLAPERVGAMNLGGLDSRDLMRPGVAVIEQPAQASGGPTVVIRIGAESNRRDVQPFEGAYFALYVRQIGPDGFGGGWASGGVGSDEARGHFCAVRVGP